jgi:hypothetical protein
MNQIYSKENFVIIRADAEFIVINKDKQFKDGHTHIRNFKTAKYLIDMVIHRRIPYHLPIYLLVSLRRLSADDIYTQKLQRLIAIKENRKQQYINR